MRGPLYVGNSLKLQSGELTISGSITTRNDFTGDGPINVSFNGADAEYFEPVGFEGSAGSGSGETTVTRTSFRMTSQ